MAVDPVWGVGCGFAFQSGEWLGRGARATRWGGGSSGRRARCGDRALPQAPPESVARPFSDDVRLRDRTSVQPGGSAPVRRRGQGRGRGRVRGVRRRSVRPNDKEFAHLVGRAIKVTALGRERGAAPAAVRRRTATGRRCLRAWSRRGRRSTAWSRRCPRSGTRNRPRRSCSYTAIRGHGGTGTTCSAASRRSRARSRSTCRVSAMPSDPGTSATPSRATRASSSSALDPARDRARASRAPRFRRSLGPRMGDRQS